MAETLKQIGDMIRSLDKKGLSQAERRSMADEMFENRVKPILVEDGISEDEHDAIRGDILRGFGVDTIRKARTTEERLLRAPGIAIQEFNQGVLSALGAPTDILRGAVSLIPNAPKFLTDPEGLLAGSGATRKLSPRPFALETGTERLIGGAAREVGRSVPGFGVANRLARQAVRAGPVTAQSGVFRRMAEDISNIPFNTLLALEGTMAAAQGLGGAASVELLTEAFVDYGGKEGADLFGRLAVGLGPAAAIKTMRLISRGLGSLKEKFTPPVSKERVQKMVGRILRDAGLDTPEAQARIRQAADIEKRVPGTQFTTAERARTSGLVAKQASASTDSIANQQVFNDIRRRNQRAVVEAFEDVPGKPGGAGIHEVNNYVRTRMGRINEALVRRNIRATENVQAKLLDINPGITKEELGAETRRLIELRRDEVAAHGDALYDAVKPETHTINVEEIRETAEGILDARPKLEDPEDTPDAIGRILKRLGIELQEVELFDAKGVSIGTEMQEVTTGEDLLSEVIAGRKAVIRAILKEQGAGLPNRNKVRKLEIMRKAYDQVLDGVETSGELGSAEAVQNYRLANSHFKNVEARFRRSRIGQVLRPGKFGSEFAIEPSDVFEQFVKGGKGSIEAYDELAGVVGEESAKNMMRRMLSGSLLDAAGDIDGTLDSKRFGKWVRDNQAVFDAHPEFKRFFSSTQAAQKRVLDVEKFTRRTRDMMDKNAVNLLLPGKADADVAVRNALAKKRPTHQMQELFSFVKGDKAAVRGLRRAFWNEFMASVNVTDVKDSSDILLVPRKAEAFMTKFKGALQVLYTPKEIKTLEGVLEAARISDSVLHPPVRGSRTSSDIKLANPKVFAMALTRARSIKMGMISKTFGAAELSARIFNNLFGNMSRDRLEVMMLEALIDPSVAETMLGAGTRPPAKTKSMIRAHLLSFFGKRKFNEDEDAPKPQAVTQGRQPVAQRPRFINPIISK